MEDEDMEAGMQSVDTMSSTPTGVETPEVIDLWKQQRKESERPTDKQLYQLKVLSRRRKWYVVGAQDKAGVKRFDLLKNQKSDKVDVTIHPEELEVMDDVLAAKYEAAREEGKLRNQKEDFSDMLAEECRLYVSYKRFHVAVELEANTNSMDLNPFSLSDLQNKSKRKRKH
ncbi:hypothetical protein ZWY2020_023370 [Hordeum vulgare]|nr:hypothetical protein ZWY2020_023370 [Hordeum vulgare]